jgi:hypothetical protein
VSESAAGLDVDVDNFDGSKKDLQYALVGQRLKRVVIETGRIPAWQIWKALLTNLRKNVTGLMLLSAPLLRSTELLDHIAPEAVVE